MGNIYALLTTATKRSFDKKIMKFNPKQLTQRPTNIE
jgi:hypothetical protein